MENEIKKGDEVYYAGAFYEVAEIKQFPHGKMIGIYDEKPSKHIDYLNYNNVKKAHNCYNCQGGGCTVCSGFGKLI